MATARPFKTQLAAESSAPSAARLRMQYRILLSLGSRFGIFEKIPKLENSSLLQFKGKDPEAARTARDSLDLVFRMSSILETVSECHTLILIALSEIGINPESLAAVVKELRRDSSPSSSSSDQGTVASPNQVRDGKGPIFEDGPTLLIICSFRP